MTERDPVAFELRLKTLPSELQQIRTLAIMLKDLIKALPQESRALLTSQEFIGRRRWGLIRVLYTLAGACNKASEGIENKKG